MALDLADSNEAGAVAIMRRSGGGWFCDISIWGRDATPWEELESTGEIWPLDPKVRPSGFGFAFSTSTFSFRRPGSPWISTLAGALASETSSLALHADGRSRAIRVWDPGGIFVAVAVTRGHPRFELVAGGADERRDRIRYAHPLASGA